jgi:hypothetical protein
METSALGKALISAGLLLALAGGALLLARRVPWLGRLPGDIRIEGEGTTFYFPITTCLLLSALLTAVFFLLSRLRR